jgi:hypothetical protein
VPVRRSRRLTSKGARKVAVEVHDEELDRLIREADDAALALTVAIQDMPVGDRIDELPEWHAFREKALAFRAAAEWQAMEKGLVPAGYFT